MTSKLARSLVLAGLAGSGLPGTAVAQPQEQPSPAPPTVAVPAITASGRVIDRAGQPIAGARVGAEGSSTRVTTDRAGWFATTAPLGTTLVIEHPGDELGLAVVSGATLDDIVLSPLEEGAETIEVRGAAPVVTPGAAALDREELQRVPGAGGDVVRALTVMPGVVNQQIPAGYAGVPIRGSSPQDSRLLIDGFEVPILFHNLGFRAVLPAEAIATLDYLPGGFDVSYGRASSGIIAVTTRPGDERQSVQGEVSLLDGGLLAQGKAGKGTRYLVALRRSTIDLVLPSLLPPDADLSFTTVPSYYDGQVRIDQQLGARWKLVLSGIGATDTLELFLTKNTDALTKRIYNRTSFARLTAAAHYHEGPWTAQVALSGVVTQFIIQQGVDQHIEATMPAVTPRLEVVRTIGKLAGLADMEVRAGVEAQLGYTTADIASPREDREGEPLMAYDPSDVSLHYHGTFWTPDFAQWIATAANLDPRIRVTLGLRADELARSGEVALQPRGQLEAKLTPTVTARLSSGAYRRPPEYQTELIQGDLESERSNQHIAGLQYQPREGLRLQASAYYTTRSHLITREMDRLGNQGRGTSAGGELLATYRGGPWFGWLAYTYSHSTRVDHPGDPTRLFSYDQPHSLNAAASWKRGRWQLGGRFQAYSGMPYTPATGSVFDADRNLYIPTYGEPNSARTPLHHQLDLRVDYSWAWGPTSLTAFLDVQNVYMNQSVAAVGYGYDYSQQQNFTSLPIVPSIGLRGVL